MSGEDTGLTGVWHGLYSYPIYFDPVYFVATLISSGPSLSGTTHEAVSGQQGASLVVYASLAGSREDARVDFLKTYTGPGVWKHHVNYSGLLNSDASEIEGNWSLPNDWSGRFMMIRARGMTEAAIREAYEKV